MKDSELRTRAKKFPYNISKGLINMRPLIGMLVEIDNELSAMVLNTYVRVIERSGGIPIPFPYVDNEETVEHMVDLCDGFLFTGGVDIDPVRYGEEAGEKIGEIQAHRDDFEFRVFQRVIKTEKPILAICRGAQLVNVALGGTLYQDIPSEVKASILHRQSESHFSHGHDVRIMPDTPLHEMMGTEQIHANSFHHQAIKALGKGLEVMALAEDGIIEAVYLPGERYVRAYQWHPERLVDADMHNRMIFEDFIHACIAYRTTMGHDGQH